MKSKQHIAIRVVYFPIKIVNAVFIAALLFAELAKHISPDTWLMPTYAGLVYPVLLFINLCFVVFWMLTRQKWFLYSMLAIVLSYFSVRDTIGFSSNNHEMLIGKHITIMSYNTMSLSKYKKPTREQENLVLKHIVEQDADIVCLQEFGVSSISKYITLNDAYHALRKYPYRHATFTSKNKYRQSGIITFSKYPIIRRKTINIGDTDNAAQYSDIVIKGDTLRVFNNHLESNRLTHNDVSLNTQTNLQQYTDGLTAKLSVAYRKRAHQAEAVAKEIKKSPYKPLVCGDFNDVPVSYTYHTMKGNLLDAFTSNAVGLGVSYNDKFLPVRIDYILHHKDLKSFNFRKKRIRCSDHYPIQCSITIP